MQYLRNVTRLHACPFYLCTQELEEQFTDKGSIQHCRRSPESKCNALIPDLFLPLK